MSSKSLGHTPRIHDWEISGGGDIAAWMEERIDAAFRVMPRLFRNLDYLFVVERLGNRSVERAGHIEKVVLAVAMVRLTHAMAEKGIVAIAAPNWFFQWHGVRRLHLPVRAFDNSRGQAI